MNTQRTTNAFLKGLQGTMNIDTTNPQYFASTGDIPALHKRYKNFALSEGDRNVYFHGKAR
ncbi:hypothetical protein [Serratia symbiotica]|uniref:hypothetical protein n=1 Tax=Serratia symbiotica TaxID=138074 RepID=UPI003CC8999F